MYFSDLQITTRQEAVSFLKVLEECTTSVDLETKLPSIQGNFVKNYIYSEKKNLQEAVVDIKRYISNLKEIIIYISFSPSLKFTSTVSDILATKKTETLIDFKVDKNIIGGSIVSINGKLYDESLKKKITDILTKHHV